MARLQKCPKHPEMTAKRVCEGCGRAICSICEVRIDADYYCKECAKGLLGGSKAVSKAAEPEPEIKGPEPSSEPESSPIPIPVPESKPRKLYWGCLFLGGLQAVPGVFGLLFGVVLLVVGLASGRSPLLFTGVVCLVASALLVSFGTSLMLVEAWAVSLYLGIAVLSLFFSSVTMALAAIDREPSVVFFCVVLLVLSAILVAYLSNVKREL